MTTTFKSKNAPLDMPADRDAFVQWAISQPDGNICAGYQPLHTGLSREPRAPQNANSTAAASDHPQT
jgi:hypothetical protein